MKTATIKYPGSTLNVIGATLALLFLSACQTASGPSPEVVYGHPQQSVSAMQGDKTCSSETQDIDFWGFKGKAFYVPMNGKCFAAFYSGPEKADELVVYLNGHNSSSFKTNGGVGNPNAIMFRDADKLVAPNRAFVNIVRHGHCLSINRDKTSFCSDGRHPATDYWLPELADDLAYLVKYFKSESGAQKVVMVGTSAGSTFSGIILGRYPGLVDGAVLVSCNCTVHRRLRHFGSSPVDWPQSVSPDMYIEQVPDDAVVIALAGGTDRMTPAYLNEKYIEELQQAGVQNAHFTEREGFGHGYHKLVQDGFGPDAILTALGHQSWPH